MEKKTVNLEDFFSDDNEKAGIWFEPKIDGEPCGIEFLVTGAGTDDNLVENERYEKAMAEAEDIKDQKERVNRRKEIDADRIAALVKGIRAADGNELMYNGKPIEYSVPVIKQLMLKSPLIKLEIVKFSTKTANFIKREKNGLKKR
jgi:hypothetical protein